MTIIWYICYILPYIVFVFARIINSVELFYPFLRCWYCPRLCRYVIEWWLIEPQTCIPIIDLTEWIKAENLLFSFLTYRAPRSDASHENRGSWWSGRILLNCIKVTGKMKNNLAVIELWLQCFIGGQLAIPISIHCNVLLLYKVKHPIMFYIWLYRFPIDSTVVNQLQVNIIYQRWRNKIRNKKKLFIYLDTTEYKVGMK